MAHNRFNGKSGDNKTMAVTIEGGSGLLEWSKIHDIKPLENLIYLCIGETSKEYDQGMHAGRKDMLVININSRDQVCAIVILSQEMAKLPPTERLEYLNHQIIQLNQTVFRDSPLPEDAMVFILLDFSINQSKKRMDMMALVERRLNSSTDSSLLTVIMLLLMFLQYNLTRNYPSIQKLQERYTSLMSQLQTEERQTLAATEEQVISFATRSGLQFLLGAMILLGMKNQQYSDQLLVEITNLYNERGSDAELKFAGFIIGCLALSLNISHITMVEINKCIENGHLDMKRLAILCDIETQLVSQFQLNPQLDSISKSLHMQADESGNCVIETNTPKTISYVPGSRDPNFNIRSTTPTGLCYGVQFGFTQIHVCDNNGILMYNKDGTPKLSKPSPMYTLMASGAVIELVNGNPTRPPPGTTTSGTIGGAVFTSPSGKGSPSQHYNFTVRLCESVLTIFVSDMTEKIIASEVVPELRISLAPFGGKLLKLTIYSVEINDPVEINDLSDTKAADLQELLKQQELLEKEIEQAAAEKSQRQLSDIAQTARNQKERNEQKAKAKVVEKAQAKALKELQEQTKVLMNTRSGGISLNTQSSGGVSLSGRSMKGISNDT